NASIASRPWRNSARFRQRLSGCRLAGSRVFQASSATRAFSAAVSAEKGGRGGRLIMRDSFENFETAPVEAAVFREPARDHLDIDPTTHPAWTGGSQHLVDRGGRLSRFNSRFGNLSFGKGKK